MTMMLALMEILIPSGKLYSTALETLQQMKTGSIP